jgi:hypothetical protein
MINESDYKRIYNVMYCAGITDTTMDYTTETRGIYEKIANWINSDEWLSEIFTAKVIDISVSSSTCRYCVKLYTKWGCGLFYGATTTSGTYAAYNTLGHFTFQGTNADVCTTKSSYYYVNIADLKLMVIKSPYGIIADFYDARYSSNNQICMLLTSGTDNADTSVDIGFIMTSSNSIKYMQNANTASASYTLKKRSISSKAGLITYMPELSDVICDNVRLSDGILINNQSLFEVDDQVWCTTRVNNDYVGLALRIA